MTSTLHSTQQTPSAFQRELAAAQLSELLAILPLALLAIILLGGLLAFLHWSSAAWNLVLLWCATFSIVILGNAAVWLRLRRRLDQDAAVSLRSLRWWACIRGLVWGTGAWVFLYQDHAISEASMVSLMVLSGVAAGAASSHAVDRYSALGFVFLLLGQVLLYFLVIGNLVAGFMVAFFIWYLTRAVESAHNRFVTNLQLRMDAESRETVMQEALNRAREADQLKDEFLANISHELRTPLHAIIGTSGLLAETPLTPDQQTLLQGMEGSSSQLLTLVNDMLDLSRIEAGHVDFIRSPFTLRKIMATMEAAFSAQARTKQLTFECRLDERLPDVLRGDDQRLQQILLNLISNAIKYTDTGGVVVSAALDSENETEIRVKFMVKDTGIGIPDAQLEQVFDKFHRVARTDMQHRGGTGLGLPIVKRLVEMQGGKIGITSTEQKGSTFYFVLPLGKPSAGDLLTHSGPHALPTAAPGRALRVLLVDDVDMNRFVIGRQIKNLWPNAVVETAVNGCEAVEKVQACTDPFDLVLMDIQMPVMDGHAATAAIRKLPPPQGTTVIIALSAGLLSAKELQGSAFNDHLLKPFAPIDLYKKVNDLL